MDEVQVSAEDISRLAQALDTGNPPLPAPDLLRAIAGEIQSRIGEDETVSVTVEIESVPDLFEAAFVADPDALAAEPEAPAAETSAFFAEPAADSPSAGQHIRVTVAKIHR